MALAPSAPRIKPVVWILLGLVVGGGALALWQLPAILLAIVPVGDLMQAQETAPLPVLTEELPQEYKTKALTYGTPPAPKERPPIATPIVRPMSPPTPQVTTPPPTPPPAPAPTHQASLEPLPGFLQTWQQQEGRREQVPQQVIVQAQPQQPVKEAKKEKQWFTTPTKLNLQGTEPKAKEGSREDMAKKAEAEQLIQHAKWARARQPWKVLTMSQKLPGKLLDAVNTDEPGLTRIEITLPIYDEEGYGYELIPKGSIAIVRQEGKPEPFTSTIGVKLVQVKFTGRRGEILSFKGSGGDEQGAPGFRGSTDFHWGRLVAAGGINALLSFGLNSIGGTPSGFYASPAQQAGRDAAQSTSNDIRNITNLAARVPPTIRKSAGDFVTLQVEENIYFGKEPTVVK